VTKRKKQSESHPLAEPFIKWWTPDRSQFIDPRNDRTLLAYFDKIRRWHGYIQFIGLPQIKDNADLPIDQIYVQPRVSDTYIDPDTPTKDWPETKSPIDCLAEHRRVVVLGDPGSGKSTLVSHLAWEFACNSSGRLVDRFGPLVPVPMVLRELNIDQTKLDKDGWPYLIDVFLEHEMAAPLRSGDKLNDVIERGQALFLLDGLDEIGDVDVRNSLRNKVLAGMQQTRCHWLITSRIVGYDQVPFHNVRQMFVSDENGSPSYAVCSLADVPFHYDEAGLEKDVVKRDEAGLAVAAVKWEKERAVKASPIVSLAALIEPRKTVMDAEPAWPALVYAAPFSDKQIVEFVDNWYRARMPAVERAAQGREDLLSAIKRDQSIERLARVPNLLTMMALIHRVRTRLPHGRARLYEEITQAYLETIDESRGLQVIEYDYDGKLRWLAKVGFEMQRRRSDSLELKRRRSAQAESQREIIIDHQTLIGWIKQSMQETDGEVDEGLAERFVDYVARRSGLLLPRGPEQYAFVHLSFQEFFAACHLMETILEPDWEKRDQDDPVSLDSLRKYADEQSWRETLVLLFERIAQKRKWPDRLARMIYDGLETESDNYLPNAVDSTMALLARLLIDPFCGLKTEKKTIADAVFRFLRRDTKYLFLRSIGTAMVLGTASSEEVEDALSAVDVAQVKSIDLAGVGLSNISWVARLIYLQELYLSSTGVTDVSALSSLTGLQELFLTGTGVTDVSALSGLIGLQRLSLNGTGVTDVSALSNLTGLQELSLNGTGVTDVSALSNLTGLQELSLNGTGVTDVSALSGLIGLQRLDLDSTDVTDVSALSGLTGLQRLYLSDTRVTDVSALSSLTGLRELSLNGTGVTDVSVLSGLTGLQRLYLDRTGVTDVSVLSSLTGLQRLDLDSTDVTDASALSGLTDLQVLYLDDTNVSDVSALSNLTGLQELHLSDTGVTDVSALSNLTGLRELYLDGTGVTNVSALSGLANLTIFGIPSEST